ncbi:type IV conjugative transfer system protein TraL [Cupriavidus basilensis]|uniref:Type IV conjugative transfer system protein TraL n=1 Tax=Cupriavidus basilensis TaxID=68895 RepID=A0A0C4YJW7_9BURK|nr:type IV conjugative transfer system protein TraL [Cupriavidus basilensis]AJG22224.1 hypothetical protein RR42_s0633 [Cupriavidus basilensis]
MSEQPIEETLPLTLDDPHQFLFWEMDVAMITGLLFYLGFAFADSFLVGGVLGFAAGFTLQKMKSNKHKKYSVHLSYWYLPVNIGLQRTPPSAMRRFMG